MQVHETWLERWGAKSEVTQLYMYAASDFSRFFLSSKTGMKVLLNVAAGEDAILNRERLVVTILLIPGSSPSSHSLAACFLLKVDDFANTSSFLLVLERLNPTHK